MKTAIATISASICLLVAPVIADIPRKITQGDQMPDAKVKTVNGREVSLRELVKAKPAVIIFYRGGWCPYCQAHLMELAKIDDELADAGFQLLAISADKPERLAETPNRDQFNYTLFSDNTMEAAKAFGITFKVPDDTVERYKNDFNIDLEAASGHDHHLLPHPAVYVVDQSGTVQFAHVNPDYKDRLNAAFILTTAQKIAAKANEENTNENP